MVKNQMRGGFVKRFGVWRYEDAAGTNGSNPARGDVKAKGRNDPSAPRFSPYRYQAPRAQMGPIKPRAESYCPWDRTAA